MVICLRGDNIARESALIVGMNTDIIRSIPGCCGFRISRDMPHIVGALSFGAVQMHDQRRAPSGLAIWCT